MRSHISHVQINVRATNMSFYRELTSILGWRHICDSEEMVGAIGTGATTIWFTSARSPTKNDYDAPGMNHLAFGTPHPRCVDRVRDFLLEKGIAPLDSTPRHRPEFSPDENHTYYQLLFESPDSVLLEVIYAGPSALD